MVSIPLPQLQFAEGVVFAFPKTLCCNCGTPAGISVIEQDTRLTPYMIGGATEITFKLPLPFCAGCTPSAKRRPKNVMQRALLFALVFTSAFFAILIGSDVAFSVPWLTAYIVPLSLCIAAIVVGSAVLIGRSKGNQTSYYQPVRIRKLKREFISGKILSIRFSFTNKNYAQLFVHQNQDSISRKLVEVRG